MYLVSVVVFCYDNENDISDMMESLKKQSIGFDNLEINIIDFNSEDNSRRLIHKYEKEYNNVKGIYLEKESDLTINDLNSTNINNTADYLFFEDISVNIHPKLIEEMYLKIKESNTDMIECDDKLEDDSNSDNLNCVMFSKNHFKNSNLVFNKTNSNVKFHPKITLCVSFTSNKEHALKCLESIMNQSFKDIEVLCIFESYINVLKSVEKYASENSNIKVLVQDRIQDLYEYVHGDYVLFLESKDWLSLLMLEYVNDIISSSNSDVVLLSNYFYDEKRSLIYENDVFNDVSTLNQNVSPKDCKKEIFALPKYCNNLYDVSFLKENDIILPINYFDKISFHIQALVVARDIYFNSKALFYKRVNGKNSVGDYVLNNFSGTIDDVINLDKLFFTMDELIKFFKNKSVYAYYKNYLLNYIINSFYNAFYLDANDESYEKVREKIVEYSIKYNTDLVLNLNEKNMKFYRKMLESNSLKELNLMYENEKLFIEKGIMETKYKKADNQYKWTKKQYDEITKNKNNEIKKIKDEYSRKINNLNKQKRELTQNNNKLNSKLDEVKTSYSWKITKIFRKIGLIKSIIIILLLTTILMILIVLIVTTVLLMII